MRIIKLKLISILVLLAMSYLMTECVYTHASESKVSAKNRISVTDIRGRQVYVTVPINKVVLCFDFHLPTFAAIAGDDFLEKIAAWGKITPLNDQNLFKEFKRKYPRIETIPDIGTHAKGTFSVEKVISLKPDVCIFPLWELLDSYEGIAEDITRMEQAGIPTIVVDFWKEPFKNTIPSTLLIGTILGKENRATEIADFYNTRIDQVMNRVEKIGKAKPRVYLEGVSKGPNQYGWTCGYAGWGVIAAKLGGINIAEDFIKERGAIAPEYLLKINPDVIIIAAFGGSWCEMNNQIKDNDHENYENSARLFLKAVTERPGWNSLNAVKNNRVYGIFDSSYSVYNNNIHSFAAIQSIAKWLYPDEFKELDPDTDLREFDKRFLPVDHSNVWMISLQN